VFFRQCVGALNSLPSGRIMQSMTVLLCVYFLMVLKDLFMGQTDS